MQLHEISGHIKENEYAIRRLLRMMPSLSGRGERYEWAKQELLDRLRYAETYRKLTDDEEYYLGTS